MRTVHFTRTFSAAHRLWNDDSKCRNIHGHNFRVEVEIDAESLRLTEQGFLIPFDRVKESIDKFDHSLILDAADPIFADPMFSRSLGVFKLRVVSVPFPPSTENMARHLAREIADLLVGVVVTVKVRETDGIAAYGYATA